MNAPDDAAWMDAEREEGTLTKVRAEGDYYSVTRSTGWSCGVPAEHGVEPKVGDTFVTWGSIGRPIRGQAINGRVLYYRTPDEQRALDLRRADEAKAGRITEYEGQRSAMDTRAAALPALLRDRIEGFRTRGGDAWRWEFETYEMMVCEEAAKLTARFPDDASLRAFGHLGSYESQRAAFPEMDGGHSGNSWSAAVGLAMLVHEKPELVAQQHGALCPLVGCESYHCWSTTAGAA